MMLRRLNTKYSDFVNESLNIQFSVGELLVNMPQTPISGLLMFLSSNDIYPDDSTLNYISLSDTINMLKYPPKNRRVPNNDDANYDIKSQTTMRIGRIVKSIINSVDKSKLSAEYKGSATFNRKDITFNLPSNGGDFMKFFESNSELFRDNGTQTTTFVKVFKDDKQIIGSTMEYYNDDTDRIAWERESKFDYLSIELVDDINLSGVEDVTIHFELKFMNKYISDITDADIEKFVNDLTAFVKINMAPEGSVISQVKGEEIRKWYNTENYQSKTGQLGGSCMSYESCQGYLDIYTENPEMISLLILKNESGKLVGRSLLWKLDDGRKFMDRVYCQTDYDVKIFEKWAIDNGCIYRNQGGNNKIKYYLNGEELPSGPMSKGIEHTKLEVTLHHCDFDDYPYIDTLCYLNMDSSTLCNLDTDSDRELRDTEGKWLEYYDEDGN